MNAELEEKIKVVVDTNVIISGLNYKGNERRILNLIQGREIAAYVSPFILEEPEKVLREKFHWEKGRIQKAIQELQLILIEPKRRLPVIKEKDSDNRILECAIEAEVHYLISGDEHHILPLQEFQGIKILSPAEFLRFLL
jgi:hypothetical protein